MAKFTSAQALENIKSRFTNAEGKSSLQLSDRSIKETLDALLPIADDQIEVADFVEKYAYKAIDTMNRNLIHDNSEFAKNYNPNPPTPPTPPTPPVDDKEAMKTMFKELLAEEMKSVKDDLEKIKGKGNLEARDSAVSELRKALKLSKAWDIDFDNSLEIAKYQLGNEATAQQIFDKAKEHFNNTLSRRGEEYKPQAATGDPQVTDFSKAAERRKAAKAADDRARGIEPQKD